MEQFLQLTNDLIDKLFIYGPFWIYVFLFLASFIENIFPPIPGDFITVTGGALAASGRLNIYLVFLMVYFGGILSMMLIYYLGRSRGRDFFMRKNYKIFSRDDIPRLEDWFTKRGVLLLIFNRFIVGVRAVIALVAGISRYNPVKKFVFVSISFWIFNGLLLFSSYLFVINFDSVFYYLRLYEKIVWPIIIVILIIFVVIKFRRAKLNGR
ncbi:MAG: DedA family protein [candidate division Zixibacteria bacterium]|nr:DedA family protein [candidate division Zixibacteria bacterium]